MTAFARFIPTAILAGGLAAAPLAAQQPYPQQPYPQQPYPQQPYEQPYQQPYPGQTYPGQTYPGQTYPGQTYPGQTYPGQTYPGQTYPQQGYGYGQGYDQNAIGAIIDGLIGNRYTVNDRTAIHQCAYAAVQRAHGGYAGGYAQQPYGGYPQPYGGYNNHGWMRVTAITEVRRRSNGRVRVRGTLGGGWNGNPGNDPRYGSPPYGGPGYGGPGYGGRYGHRELSFRCDVDYNGYVRDVRLEPLVRAY